MKNSLAVLLVVIAVLVSGGATYFVKNSQTVTTTATVISPASSTSVTCTFPGQFMGFNMSLLSDSSLTPAVGANVTAHYKFNGSCGGFQEIQTTQTFTTNNTEWYSLSGLNNGNYTISVVYSGHIYNFTAQLRPSVYTCAKLFLPSGKTNVTFTPTSC